MSFKSNVPNFDGYQHSRRNINCYFPPSLQNFGGFVFFFVQYSHINLKTNFRLKLLLLMKKVSQSRSNFQKPNFVGRLEQVNRR